MGYRIWKSRPEEGVCSLGAVQGVTNPIELNRGISKAGDWPSDAHCKMRDKYPKDILLADNMHAMGLTVISKALEDAVVDHATNVEFLPLTIINHKGKPASTDYSIVNPIDVIDCIDADASNLVWSPLKKDLVTDCDQLVLDEGRIKESAKIFRPKFMPIIILIDEELAGALERANFTGLLFKDPLEFTGI